ncbi:MAG TPA: LysM peptidoglycan-binding domain-containing protein [Oscillatoriaceae cyanobacterium]
MDTRLTGVTPPTTVVPTTSGSVPTAAMPQAINTSDAVNLSASGNPSDLGAIQSAIADLDSRVSALEQQMAALGPQSAPATPTAGQPADLSSTVQGLQSTVSSELDRVNNLIAQTGASTGSAAPTASAPTSQPTDLASTVQGLQSTVNSELDRVNSLIAATGGASTGNPAAPTAGDSAGQPADLAATVKDLQNTVNAELGRVNNLLTLTGAPANGAQSPVASSLAQQQAGLQAVSSTLAGAKLTNLTPQETQVVGPALARVDQIGQAIGAGANPNQYAGELFSLKYTLMDPSGAGQQPLVTNAAQVVDGVNQQKTAIEGQLAQLQQASAQGPLSPAQQQRQNDLSARYKALIDDEKALDDAKLSNLSAAGQKNASEAIGKLGAIANQLGSGQLSPDAAEQQILPLAQTLKNPNGTGAAATPAGGSDALTHIQSARKALNQKLQAIDNQIAQGQPAEKFAGERTQLLENLGQLDVLASAMKGANLQPGSTAAQREITQALKQTSTIADSLGAGQSSSKTSAQVFVLKQAFESPVASKNNPAIQSASAALQMIGTGAQRNLQAQQAIEAKINAGADPRQFDTQLNGLARQEADLEAMSRAIEQPDYNKIPAAQQPQAAKLVDQMRDIAVKVASGDDYGKYQTQFEGLAKQLDALQAAAAPAAAAQPQSGGKGAGPEPGGVYVVKSGDYLTKIARAQLGDPSRYKDIVALNVDKYPSLAKNPDMIYPGWQLTMPKS